MNKALLAYVEKLETRYLRTAPPLGRVVYDDRVHVVENALGLHVTTTRAHRARLHNRREVRVASLLEDAPPDFLRMGGGPRARVHEARRERP